MTADGSVATNANEVVADERDPLIGVAPHEYIARPAMVRAVSGQFSGTSQNPRPHHTAVPVDAKDHSEGSRPEFRLGIERRATDDGASVVGRRQIRQRETGRQLVGHGPEKRTLRAQLQQYSREIVVEWEIIAMRGVRFETRRPDLLNGRTVSTQ